MSRATGGRRFLGGLWPAFEDDIPIEMYRAMARLRFFAAGFLAAMDVLIGLAPERGGMRADWYWYVLGPCSALLVVDSLLGLWMWKRPPSVARRPRMRIPASVGTSMTT